MEESKQNSEENNSNESPLEINNENKNEENVKAFTEFLENATDQNPSEDKINLNTPEEIQNKKKSLFIRILNDGFDGISSNPNYKMLGLLIILLVNLSLFFVIGNIGKAFLRNAGIMG